MWQSQNARVVDMASVDPLFARMRTEADEILHREPVLSKLMLTSVLNHDSLEAAVIYRIAARLDHGDVPAILLSQAFTEVARHDSDIADAFRADILAFFDRDPACTRLVEPLLHFKGFHAIQTHRFAHALWNAGRGDLALYLQSRSSGVFGTDIHPNARFGKGIFLDHATGLVVGVTAVVEDDVSLLHDVTLGGTGKETGDRHPKIRHGVLIGAGAKVLGNIEVGHCSRIAAGSVVLASVPAKKTVVGVPGRVVGEAGCAEPARTMDQIIAQKITERDMLYAGQRRG